MRPGKYILSGREPVECFDLMQWAAWFETADSQRRVARDEIGPYVISTVFLALDYNFSERGPPILFETMIFRDRGDWQAGDEYQTRCSTWEEAEAMHAEAVKIARAKLD